MFVTVGNLWMTLSVTSSSQLEHTRQMSQKGRFVVLGSCSRQYSFNSDYEEDSSIVQVQRIWEFVGHKQDTVGNQGHEFALQCPSNLTDMCVRKQRLTLSQTGSNTEWQLPRGTALASTAAVCFHDRSLIGNWICQWP